MRRCITFATAVLLTISGMGTVVSQESPLRTTDVRSYQAPSNDPGHLTYRGYYLDLSEIAGRPDFAVLSNGIQDQIDTIESVRLSPRVLQFFHRIPIVVDDLACAKNNDAEIRALACYGYSVPERSHRVSCEFTVWDSNAARWTNSDPIDLAQDARLGFVLVRTALMLDPENPTTLLHEMLHAYHAHLAPDGVKDAAVRLHYSIAKTLYPVDAYLATDEKEFFAVTASVFLYGRDGTKGSPIRSIIKEKQPQYYNYLVWLFGFDPERDSTVASVN
jgi:hypothetical protein